jgi:RNA polymerase subunit RPABC4/transcription elongation factor Spt4
MNSKICQGCENEISQNAKVCPYCGMRYTTNAEIARFIFMVIMAIAIIFIILHSR